MQLGGLRFGAATSDIVDCGVLNELGVPDKLTLACWFIPTSQGAVAQRLISKLTGASNNIYLTHANASNNRVNLTIPRQSAFVNGLAEASSFRVNWTSHLGEPIFIAGTADLAGGLPRLYVGSLRCPAAEPSAYVTQTIGSGTINDTTNNHLDLGNVNAGTVPLIGTMLWAYIGLAELTLAEIIRLQDVIWSSIPPRDFRGYINSWRPGNNGRGAVVSESNAKNYGTLTGVSFTGLYDYNYLVARRPNDLGFNTVSATRVRQLAAMGVG